MKKKHDKLIIIFIFSFLSSFYLTLFSSSGDIYLETPSSNEINELDDTLKFDNYIMTELASFLHTFIKQPLWQNTRVPAIRGPLYIGLHKMTDSKKPEFALDFFYNEVPHMKVTIGSLLQEAAINQEDEILELLLQNISEAQDRLMVASLFKKITMQERRIGFLIKTGVKRNHLSAKIQTSLFIDERNFWLNVTDRTLLLALLQIDISKVPIKEFYKLRIGIGDTRIAFGLDDLQLSQCSVNVGVQTTIPTSKFSYRPHYQTNIESIANTTDISELTTAMTSIVRNIRDYLLDPRFGNSGHFGAGVYVEPKTSFFQDKLHLWGRLSFDALFAANEDRLCFFKQTTLTAINGVNQEALNYLEQNVFPTSFNVCVRPSGILNSVLAISADVGKACWTIGYDFYAQKREFFKKINNSKITLQDLNINDAESLSVSQHKIFVEFLYQNHFPVSIGIGGDFTLASANIGRDWTAYLKTTFLF